MRRVGGLHAAGVFFRADRGGAGGANDKPASWGVWAPPTPAELLAGGGYCVGDPDACIRVIEEFESMGVDEIMPIFQAGHATHEEVMNSIRLFGKYIIPHFREKAKRTRASAVQP